MTVGLRSCVAVSLALHAALLLAGAHDGVSGGSLPASSPAARPPSPMQLRLAPDAAGEFLATGVLAVRAALEQPATTHLPLAGAGPWPDPEWPAASLASATQAREGDGPATLSPALEPRLQDYVPRPLLTLAPTPLHDIALAYPGDGPGMGLYLATVTLYIDALGLVRAMDFDGPGLPEALRRQARQAFETARFTPGEVDGQAVGSRIRLELLFESRLLPRPAAEING